MKQNDLTGIESLLTNRRMAVENLMRCPLCGTVNSRLNVECFVCRWHGEFDHEARSVQEGLLDLLEQCPELVDSIVFVPRKRESILSRAIDWFGRRGRKSLNLRV
ncbi:MAG TPA: hypothetical protein VMI31_09660 [Fimbriimonadaceae bacterium]|nr:hypothetical protein [Fimbriimonadaceae bacterium]